METLPSPSGNCVLLANRDKIPGRQHLDDLQNFNEKQLEALLHSIQRRLGTSQEQVGDFDYARVVAHELNNLLTVSRLKQGLAFGVNPISA